MLALAKSYLQWQHKLWPELSRKGKISKCTSAILTEMVADLKHRHRGGSVNVTTLEVFHKLKLKLAGSYCRFSCDRSDPTSIIDQLTNTLTKAKERGYFIPWELVYCDYAVSGLTASRLGYTSYKNLLSAKDVLSATFIDDFTRASREELEWWKLAALSKFHRKSLYGASDGFDLDDANSEVMITVYGLLSRLFIKQLRQKVKRGMGGAHRRRHVLGRPPLGFTRSRLRDESGHLVRDSQGTPVNVIAIEPRTSKLVRLIFWLFVKKLKSAYEIAQFLNLVSADDWNGWTESGIKKILSNHAYRGLFIWNKTRKEYNPETERDEVMRNPHKEWVIQRHRDLAFIPKQRFLAAYWRLKQTRRKSPTKRSRNQLSASTLFSGTLFCASCDQELKLIRSAGKYQQIACMNGSFRVHGCQLTTSKSVRIIEKCLLKYMLDVLLTEEAVETLVSRANKYLASQSLKPRQNDKRFKKSIEEKQAKIDKLVRLSEDADDDLCQGYKRRILAIQNEVNQLKEKLREIRKHNASVPPLLDTPQVKEYLKEARVLLNQDIPVAAAAIRALTGNITISQEPIPGRKTGARWIAKFRPDLVSLLRRLARDQNYPDSITLEYLSNANWTIPEMVEVPLEHITQYQKLGPKFAELFRQGARVQELADSFGMPWKQAKEILDFGLTGKLPRWTNNGRPESKKRGQAKHLVIQDDVVRLRDEELRSILKIKSWLLKNRDIEVSESTIRRAYAEAHKDEIHNAVMKGETPNRGRSRRISRETIQMIRKLLVEGKLTAREIARKAGVSSQTVERERKLLK
ncbi:hypothetical protein GCM10023155_19550 [Bremerella cremea]